VAEEHLLEVRDDERTDTAFDLCKANSESLRKEQPQEVSLFTPKFAAAEISACAPGSGQHEFHGVDSDLSLLVNQLGKLVNIGIRDIRDGAVFHPLTAPMAPLIPLPETRG